jgi:transcriptional regulator with XRE-family HTH domain
MLLSDFLKTNGITLAAFAEEIGTSAATVSRISDGLVVPRRKLLVRIYEATGGQVCPNDLTGIHPPSGTDIARQEDKDG